MNSVPVSGVEIRCRPKASDSKVRSRFSPSLQSILKLPSSIPQGKNEGPMLLGKQFRNRFEKCRKGSNSGRVKSMVGQESCNNVQSQSKVVVGVKRASSFIELRVQRKVIGSSVRVRKFAISPNVKRVLALLRNVSGREGGPDPSRVLLRIVVRKSHVLRISILVQLKTLYQKYAKVIQNLIQLR